MGQRDAAIAVYERWLPLINYENKQCGLRATKALMAEGGIIASEAVRHPTPPLAPGDAGRPGRAGPPPGPADPPLGPVRG